MKVCSRGGGEASGGGKTREMSTMWPKVYGQRRPSFLSWVWGNVLLSFNSTNSRYTGNSRLFLCGWTWPQPAAVLDNLVLEVSSRLAGDSSRKCRVVTEVIVVTTQARFDIVATPCTYNVGWCSQAQKYFFPIGLNVLAIEMIDPFFFCLFQQPYITTHFTLF